jgi:LacI family transcriptional regulator
MEAIAHAAGVSVPTVSRVLSGRGQVAPDTRERIRRLLDEQEYEARRSSAGRSTGLIQVVFPGICSGWETEHVRGIEQVAQEAGVGLVVSVLRRGEALRRGELMRTDGVILAATSGVYAAGARVPTVALDPVTGAAAGAPSIGATNFHGGRAVTRHLIGLGHRRIGLVTGAGALRCSRDRADGYRAALEEAELEEDPTLIVEGGEFTHRAGLVAGRRLLAHGHPPTAIVASSDTMALGVLEAARQRGVSVPGELSVTGFDDLPASRWSSPPLTTVRQPLQEMGRLAARTVLRLAQGRAVDHQDVELSTRLIVRESTAPPGS